MSEQSERAELEIDRLKTELSAERAKGLEDSLRLEWMGEHDARCYILFGTDPVVWRVVYRPHGRPDHEDFLHGDDMRAAIDAGRKATGGGE